MSCCSVRWTRDSSNAQVYLPRIPIFRHVEVLWCGTLQLYSQVCSPSQIRLLFHFVSFRYVYSPFKDSYRGRGGNFLSGLLCFVFVAIFHGKVFKCKNLLMVFNSIWIWIGIENTHVLIWCLLNWIGIVCETIARKLYKKSAQYQKIKGNFLKNILEEKNILRILEDQSYRREKTLCASFRNFASHVLL